jgi:hypothetical protein
MQELEVHLRTVISDTGKDVAPGVAAGMTTLLLQAVVDPLPNTLQLSTCTPYPRQVACSRLLGLYVFNLEWRQISVMALQQLFRYEFNQTSRPRSVLTAWSFFMTTTDRSSSATSNFVLQ